MSAQAWPPPLCCGRKGNGASAVAREAFAGPLGGTAFLCSGGARSADATDAVVSPGSPLSESGSSVRAASSTAGSGLAAVGMGQAGGRAVAAVLTMGAGLARSAGSVGSYGCVGVMSPSALGSVGGSSPSEGAPVSGSAKRACATGSVASVAGGSSTAAASLGGTAMVWSEYSSASVKALLAGCGDGESVSRPSSRASVGESPCMDARAASV